MTPESLILLVGFVAVGVITAPLLVALFNRYAAVFLAIHLIVVCAVPYWFGLSLGGVFLPASLLSTAAVLALSVLAPRQPPSGVDLLLIGLGVATLAAAFTDASYAQWLNLLLAWVLPFVLGRRLGGVLAPDVVSRVFLSLAAALAVWSLVEFAFDWHPFVSLGRVGSSGDVWSSIQYRGGLPRSEGAFGTSIVFGNVLALFLPFVFSAPVPRRLKAFVVVLVVAGVAVTFSRNSLIALVIGILLSSIQLRARASMAARLTSAVATGSVLLMLAAVYLSSTAEFATNEIANSTAYRQGYLSLVDTLKPIGSATSLFEYAPGRFGYASVAYPGGLATSIDSSAVLLALQFGWVPAIVLLALYVAIVLSALRSPGRMNAALVGAAALVPSVLTVAMVTQLPYMFWFIVGLGVSMGRASFAAPPLRPWEEAAATRTTLREENR